MNNDISLIIKRLAMFIIGIAIIVVVAHVFVFLLPFILLFLVFYYLYRFYYGKKNTDNDSKEETKNDFKGIKNDIEEADIIKEKFDN